MAQRVKPVDPSDVASYAVYANELELLHGLMVNVMKSKQTTDSIYVDNMKGLLEEFWWYMRSSVTGTVQLSD